MDSSGYSIGNSKNLSNEPSYLTKKLRTTVLNHVVPTNIERRNKRSCIARMQNLLCLHLGNPGSLQEVFSNVKELS